MLDRLIDTRDRLDAHLERQVLAAPVLLGGGNEVAALGKTELGGDSACGLIPVREHTVLGKNREHLRQEHVRNGRIDKQRFGRVANAHTLRLGVHDDRQRLGKVGIFVHVDMAIAGAGLDHGNERLAHAALDEPRPAARNQHVDDTAQAHERARGLAVAGLDKAHGLARESARLHRVGEHRGDHRARMVGERPAAQDAGVARADADTRSIGGDVGARLVDHGHQTERHGHARKFEPAVDGAVVEHAAHGIGQLGKLLKTRSHALYAFGREQQTVEQALRGPLTARGVHVDLVGGHDRLRARTERGGHGAHGIRALLVACRPERTRGRLGAFCELLYIGMDILGHGFTHLANRDGPARARLSLICVHGTRAHTRAPNELQS